MSLAEGHKQAAILKAQGESEAIRCVMEALKQSRSDPAQYLIAIRYIEAMSMMAEGQGNKTVFIPYEATAALGSLGGIKELFAAKGEKTPN